MRVNVSCCSYVRMTEAFFNSYQVNARSNKHGRARVAYVMETNFSDVMLINEFFPFITERIGMIRLSVCLADYKV